MVTHGSTFALLRNLRSVDEPTCRLSRNDQLQLVRNDVLKSIRKAYEMNQRQYNLRSRPQTFHVGQQVMRRNFVQSSLEKHFNAKLAPLFVKARIREKLGSNYYILEDLDGKIVGTFH
ncbi:uncharacterized protein LOC142235545 [Haematobia irritans]|uniref:uncharacterized protein LOC142235545 n=1 Tax=Haematobia irritans TaxID=7368 RepID=UPI003F4F9644